ncbi:unnamed protein product [Brassica rapa]|uniref:Uncharacterized protein n=2 Tax=Brassica TaxID=3705 RepID=A0A3P5YHT1_BRACM|nr:unnamed protein product [Brassica napus]CAG7862143.1 unnamed protein product [Brassica rapa]VDC60401.1 unnamed protein product [Brassica rapa]
MPITIIFLLFSVSSSLSPLCHDRTVETIKSHLHNCHIVTAINNPSLLKDNDGAEIKTRQQPMSSSFLAPPLEVMGQSPPQSPRAAQSPFMFSLRFTFLANRSEKVPFYLFQFGFLFTIIFIIASKTQLK